jgi:hypothetical protein
MKPQQRTNHLKRQVLKDPHGNLNAQHTIIRYILQPTNIARKLYSSIPILEIQMMNFYPIQNIILHLNSTAYIAKRLHVDL